MGQKVVLLAMTYGELSTMVPLQAFHPPFCTAPRLAEMRRVTVFLTSTEPHLVMSALVLPAYPDPDLVKVIVNRCASKPGAAKSASVVSMHRFPVHAGENVHVSLHFCPTLRLARDPGVLVVVTSTGTSPSRGGASVEAARTEDKRDPRSPHLASTWYW
jgi:hypothetical protein